MDGVRCAFECHSVGNRDRPPDAVVDKPVRAISSGRYRFLPSIRIGCFKAERSFLRSRSPQTASTQSGSGAHRNQRRFVMDRSHRLRRRSPAAPLWSLSIAAGSYVASDVKRGWPALSPSLPSSSRLFEPLFSRPSDRYHEAGFLRLWQSRRKAAQDFCSRW
jgi:hypothetical protein